MIPIRLKPSVSGQSCHRSGYCLLYHILMFLLYNNIDEYIQMIDSILTNVASQTVIVKK